MSTKEFNMERSSVQFLSSQDQRIQFSDTTTIINFLCMLKLIPLNFVSVYRWEYFTFSPPTGSITKLK